MILKIIGVNLRLLAILLTVQLNYSLIVHHTELLQLLEKSYYFIFLFTGLYGLGFIANCLLGIFVEIGWLSEEYVEKN